MASRPKLLSLALQGGGSHGAYTWGVLDALLEDGRLTPGAITATSAGAMNAAALAHGWLDDGADGARASLEAFWQGVAHHSAAFRPLVPGGAFLRMVPFLDALSRLTSPYDLNPFNADPLRDILQAQIDFERLRAHGDIRLFITATCVTTGRAEVFSGERVTLDAVLASACLPFLRQAVEIDGEPYWDGGFTGNPALWPLFYADTPGDLLIVHINPLNRPGTPKSADDIMNRVNEITFNASLMAELRAVAFVKRLIEDDLLVESEKKRLRNVRMHAIRADEALSGFSAASKYDTSWTFLTRLRDAGRQAAKDWLESCHAAIGRRSSIDVRGDYLGR
ncbi:MAG: patatin-like phospholipase family protein [Oceanicaulis sp.]|uniref:patatin-like phospholipase family protein n=1 Tax=Glycocaulis sp. TaxID=1969725 RepID=UPI0025C46B42|nr:patatin-like phospholipase family protein [Glycocaulis sp.]MCC5980273.1 patatin-like phospholipase family protein [Oceanicaulis sp.]MCH8522459.1 patatin-like phospholipase family protein [Glycocaulis sp.]